MHFSDEKNILTEVRCGETFSYILKEKELFQPTEYKVLQGQSDGYFVKCMKMQFNGMIQLLYMPQTYRSFDAVYGELSESAFVNVIANLLFAVNYVKQMGFLSCQNIDLSPEHLYVDTTTYKVGLTYLPINAAMCSNPYSNFDNEFRTALVEMISKMGFKDSLTLLKLKDDLLDSLKSLEDICKGLNVKNEENKPQKPVEPVVEEDRKKEPQLKERKLHIIALNGPTDCDFEVNKEEFVLGKDSTVVDGAITFNKLISRSHCKVVKLGQEYRIKDLDSTNGTYVNSVRVRGNETCPIKDGDVIRLANSDFQVKFR